MLKTLKTAAIVCAIAVGATAVIMFGMFIGTILLVLAAIAGVALVMVFLWKIFTAD